MLPIRQAALSVLAGAFALLASTLAPAGAHAASGRITVAANNARRTATVVEYRRLKKGRRATIIVLHGGHSTGGRIRRILGLDEVAFGSGRVMVYPDGIDGRWHHIDNHETGPNDQAFIFALINRLVADGITDRRRVYLMGFSTGGMLALRMACEHADAFAGVGAIAATLPADIAATCKPSRPIPTILVDGTADPLVPFQGGKSGLKYEKAELASAPATIAPFVAAAGCSQKPPAVLKLPDHDRNDGSRVALVRYLGCKAPVEMLRVDGGGHTIPGRRSIAERGVPVGAHNGDINAGRRIFDFFRHHGR